MVNEAEGDLTVTDIPHHDYRFPSPLQSHRQCSPLPVPQHILTKPWVEGGDSVCGPALPSLLTLIIRTPPPLLPSRAMARDTAFNTKCCETTQAFATITKHDSGKLLLWRSTTINRPQGHRFRMENTSNPCNSHSFHSHIHSGTEASERQPPALTWASSSDISSFQVASQYP